MLKLDNNADKKIPDPTFKWRVDAGQNKKILCFCHNTKFRGKDKLLIKES